MKNNFYSDGIMRRMRRFSYDIEKNYHSQDKRLAELDGLKVADEITQTVYDREASTAHEAVKKQRIKLVEEARKDLMATLQKMREVAGKRIVQAPSPEIVNTLQLLSMLDDISPTQFNLYAAQMEDCPLAMQRLQQIAKAHDQKIYVDDPENRLRALDLLEGNLANYLENFTGDITHAPFSVQSMYRYFQPDDSYMGNPKTPTDTERVNKMFWDDFVRLSSPDVFDDPDNAKGAPKAQYFFSDVAALSAFIKKMTAGVTGSMVEDITNQILENCPEQYGAIWRSYKATGEMLDLNGTDSE